MHRMLRDDEVICESITNDGVQCRRKARWVVEHRGAALRQNVCTQHQTRMVAFELVEEETGWTVIDTIPSRKEPPHAR